MQPRAPAVSMEVKTLVTAAVHPDDPDSDAPAVPMEVETPDFAAVHPDAPAVRWSGPSRRRAA
eukprot:6172912-Pleurochrysis_carterae.AAC.2